MGGGETCRARLLRERRPDQVACGTRRDDLEATLARVAKTPDTTWHSRNVRPHMREIRQRAQRFDLARGTERAQARRTLHREDRRVGAELADRYSRSSGGLQRHEFIAASAEDLEAHRVKAPNREIAEHPPSGVDAQRVADASGLQIVDPPRRQGPLRPT